MEALGVSGAGRVSAVVKKRRSSTSRRPWRDPQLSLHDHSPPLPSSAPSLDNKSKLLPGESDPKHYNEGVLALLAPVNNWNSPLAPVNNWNSSSIGKDNLDRKLTRQDHSVGLSGTDSAPQVSTERKLTVKLKLGGVTRTVNEKFHPSQNQQKLVSLDNSDGDFSSRKNSNGLQGHLMKDISHLNFFCETLENSHGKVNIKGEAASSVTVQNSKRVSKRQVLDATLEDSDEDDEIRYLQRIKNSKIVTNHNPESGDDKEGVGVNSWMIRKGSRRSAVYHSDAVYGLSSRSTKESWRKSRPDRGSSDVDYVGQEECGPAGVFQPKRKKQKKESVNSSADGGLEPLTTRQRGVRGDCSSLIEFPNGLSFAPSKKSKLSDMEKQTKKTEAAQRRKMQMEKAAKESEEMVIRKILGLNSDKKKAEKQGAQVDKAKAVKSETLLSNKVRLVMGPNGTVITFPKDVTLPSIFDSRPCSYPPPREKCAGPSCTNPYKYRDSRSKLPLCSLLCYRAVQGGTHSVSMC